MSSVQFIHDYHSAVYAKSIHKAHQKTTTTLNSSWNVHNEGNPKTFTERKQSKISQIQEFNLLDSNFTKTESLRCHMFIYVLVKYHESHTKHAYKSPKKTRRVLSKNLLNSIHDKPLNWYNSMDSIQKMIFQCLSLIALDMYFSRGRRKLRKPL